MIEITSGVFQCLVNLLGEFEYLILSAAAHKLNEFGIRHEAEEYNGVWGSGNWGAEGRVATEVLPFFARTMVMRQWTVDGGQ